MQQVMSREDPQPESGQILAQMNKHTARTLLGIALPVPDRLLKRSHAILCDVGMSAPLKSSNSTLLWHPLAAAQADAFCRQAHSASRFTEIVANCVQDKTDLGTCSVLNVYCHRIALST